MIPRVLGLGLVAVLVTGCSTFSNLLSDEDNSLPPAPLPKLESVLSIKTLWNERVSTAQQKQHLMLAPVLDAERIVVADPKGRVRAVAAQTGKLHWETKTPVAITGGPGVGEGRVLVGSGDGEVLALSEEDGTLQWQTKLTSEVLSAPQAAQGVVVVRTVDGKLYGLDATSGMQIWVYDRSVPALTLRGTSAPVLTGKIALIGLDSGRLTALSIKDGQPLWETPIALPRGRSELERMVDIDAQPLVVDDLVYVVTFQGAVAAVDLYSGDVLWRRDLSSYAGLGVDRQHLYVTDEQSHIWAFDRYSHASLWRQDALQGRAVTAPVAFLGYVVVGDFEGYVHWLQPKDGRLIARTRVDKKGIVMPPIPGLDTLYVYGQGGRLAALQISG